MHQTYTWCKNWHYYTRYTIQNMACNLRFLDSIQDYIKNTCYYHSCYNWHLVSRRISNFVYLCLTNIRKYIDIFSTYKLRLKILPVNQRTRSLHPLFVYTVLLMWVPSHIPKTMTSAQILNNSIMSCNITFAKKSISHGRLHNGYWTSSKSKHCTLHEELLRRAGNHIPYHWLYMCNP